VLFSHSVVSLVALRIVELSPSLSIRLFRKSDIPSLRQRHAMLRSRTLIGATFFFNRRPLGALGAERANHFLANGSRGWPVRFPSEFSKVRSVRESSLEGMMLT